jgi:hypothetical protein
MLALSLPAKGPAPRALLVLPGPGGGNADPAPTGPRRPGGSA